MLSPKYRAKRYPNVCDDADNESHADDAVEMGCDGIFDVSEKVKIVDVDDFEENSLVDDDETMADVDLLEEIYMPEFRAQAFPGIQTKAQLTCQLFSPTMAKVALMIMLSFAVADNELIFIADVSSAFLHAYFYPDELLYCRPPKGFENHSVLGGKVMRLVKALYGAR